MQQKIESPQQFLVASKPIQDVGTPGEEPHDYDDGLLAIGGPIMITAIGAALAIAAATFFESGEALFAVALCRLCGHVLWRACSDDSHSLRPRHTLAARIAAEEKPSGLDLHRGDAAARGHPADGHRTRRGLVRIRRVRSHLGHGPAVVKAQTGMRREAVLENLGLDQ